MSRMTFAWAIAVIATHVASGCASRTHRASALPPEMVAPATVNVSTINLGGLAESCVASDTVQPGDLLELTMVSDFSKLTATITPLRVAEDGTIIAPLIGRLVVGGMPLNEAEGRVAAESVARGIFRTPCVTLAMKERQLPASRLWAPSTNRAATRCHAVRGRC